MIALDTNVLVRVVTKDDPKQTAAAVEVMQAGPLWVSKTVLLETAWVLSFAYELEREVVLDTLGRIVGYENIVVEDMAAAARALTWAGAGMDFADALHVASSGEAAEFVTFDRDLVAKAKTVESAPAVRILGAPARSPKR